MMATEFQIKMVDNYDPQYFLTRLKMMEEISTIKIVGGVKKFIRECPNPIIVEAVFEKDKRASKKKP